MGTYKFNKYYIHAKKLPNKVKFNAKYSYNKQYNKKYSTITLRARNIFLIILYFCSRRNARLVFKVNIYINIGKYKT